MATKQKGPIYVTQIDEAKFTRIQEIAVQPLVWAFVFVSTGVFGMAILVIAAVGFVYF